MKKMIIFSILFLFVLSVSSQKAFFPTKEGTKLTYQNYDKKDKVTGKVKYTIKEVKGSGSNLDITYQIEMLDDKEAQKFLEEVTIQIRGDKMYFDMSNFLNKSAFPQEEGKPPTIEITGNNMEIPLVPVPGMTLPDANVSMSMKMGFINMKMTANVTNRKVEGIEEISVKGGSFNTFRISGDVNSSILGVKVNSKSTDWYAYDIGIVKTVSYDKKGNLQSSMELIEIQE